MDTDATFAHAVTLAAAFIANGDLRHDRNWRDADTEVTEQVMLLLMQMHRGGSGSVRDPAAGAGDAGGAAVASLM